MARKAAEDLRERLDIYAIAHRDDDAYCTRIDGDASMVGRWLADSYSESNNDLSFFGLSTGEAAELIRTFDEMQMAKKHPLAQKRRGERVMARDMDWRQPYEQSMALYRYIDGGGRDPNEVAEHWHRAFCCVAKYLGFNRATRRILWGELAQGNWKHLHPTEDESRYTSDKWLYELMWDVFYCSDRWSLGRLTRCHWMYRRYVRALCNEVSLA